MAIRRPKGETILVDRDGNVAIPGGRAAVMAEKKRLNLRVACLSETLGPNWKHLYLIRTTYYVPR